MKRILFILLLTIPFIGFGQKFIEKKIQTSNGTIILYTDSIKEPCYTGNRYILYSTKDCDYTYYLGNDEWFSIESTNLNNDTLDEIIVQRCNTYCNGCSKEIFILSVQNHSLEVLFDFSPYIKIINDNWKSFTIMNNIWVLGEEPRYGPHRWNFWTYEFNGNNYELIKEETTIKKYDYPPDINVETIRIK